MLRVVVVFLCFLNGNLALSNGAKELLDYVKKSEVDRMNSIQVIRVSDGKSLFSYKEDRLLSPASVTKLITAAAALEKFSPAYKFKTKFFTNGKIINGVIQGDLYVKGSGDPYLVSEKLWQLAADFKNMGIRKITGRIIIDESLFDKNSHDGLRNNSINASSNAYDAPISPFGINFNTLAIAIAPGPQLNTRAIVSIDPYPLRNVIIDNKIITTTTKTSIAVKRMTVSGKAKIILSGQINIKEGVVKKYRSVADYLATSGEILRSFLNQEGIEVTGNILEGELTNNLTLIYELESFPMSFIVEGLNKFSNNYIADVLLKNLGQFAPMNQPGPSGTYSNGIKVLNQFLNQNVGIKYNYTLKNGSGLTIENKLNAQLLSDLLVYAARNMEIFPEFIASLPSAGLDGTLGKRFDDNDTEYLEGKIRAKTGTLTSPISVSSLAGYMNHPRHGLVAFAIIQNGVMRKKQPGILELRRHQDKIISKIYSSL